VRAGVASYGALSTRSALNSRMSSWKLNERRGAYLTRRERSGMAAVTSDYPRRPLSWDIGAFSMG
jgi:hypothetical protein